MMMFLVYLCFIIRAVVISKRRFATFAYMAVVWFAVLLVIMGSMLEDGAAAWEMWGIPSFLVPAVIGSYHAWRTQLRPQEDSTRPFRGIDQ